MTLPTFVTRTVSWGRLRTAGLAGLAIASAIAVGCNGKPGAEAEPAGAAPMAGPSSESAINLAVVVPPNFQIATVDYQITKPGFTKTDSLNLSQSGTISGVIGGIPVGSGYTLALTMTDVAKRFTSCTGSSTFDVGAGMTTPVGVNIECRLPQPSLTAPPVPVPVPAVGLLAVALLAAGGWSASRGRAARDRGARTCTSNSMKPDGSPPA